MKRILAFLMIAAVLTACLAGCAKKTETPVVPGYEDQDTGPSEPEDVRVSWELKKMNPEDMLPAMTVKTEYPFSENQNLKSCLLDSPIKMPAAGDVIAELKKNPRFSGLSFYVDREEKTNNARYYDDVGYAFQIVRTDTVNGYAEGSSVPVVVMRFVCPLYANDGCSEFSLTVRNNTEINEALQEELKELLTEYVGNDLAEILVFAESDTPDNYGYYKKVTVFDQNNFRGFYSLQRGIYNGEVSFGVEYSTADLLNMDYYDYFIGDYESITKGMKYSVGDMFQGKLGTTDDYLHPADSLRYFMEKAGGRDCITILDSYLYKDIETPYGKMYKLDSTWKCGKTEESTITSSGLRIGYTITESNSGEITDFAYKIIGSTDDMPIPYNEGNEETYANMLREALSQIEFIFGDKTGLSKLTLNNFNTLTNNEGEISAYEYDTSVPFDFFGHTDTGNINFLLNTSFVDTLRCVWEFTVNGFEFETD